MLTGPRRGEVSALRWRHIDFERGLLWVHRSNAKTKAGLEEKSTKTAQTRKIALDEHTVKLLTDHRDMWARRCADLGTVLTLDAFVFSNHPDGSQPYAPRAISQRYRKLALKRCASRSGPASSSPVTSCPPSPNSPSRTRWRSGQRTERSPSSRTRA
jgi:integrase